MPDIEPRLTDTQARDELLADIGSVLLELYDPAGALIFWSARLTYLNGRRPCDAVYTLNLGDLLIVQQRLHALAEGAFA